MWAGEKAKIPYTFRKELLLLLLLLMNRET